MLMLRVITCRPAYALVHMPTYSMSYRYVVIRICNAIVTCRLALCLPGIHCALHTCIRNPSGIFYLRVRMMHAWVPLLSGFLMHMLWYTVLLKFNCFSTCLLTTLHGESVAICACICIYIPRQGTQAKACTCTPPYNTGHCCYKAAPRAILGALACPIALFEACRCFARGRCITRSPSTEHRRSAQLRRSRSQVHVCLHARLHAYALKCAWSHRVLPSPSIRPILSVFFR